MNKSWFAGHTMEGTRLTIVQVPSEPDAYEFSIRTPVTPPRWRDFEQVTRLCPGMLYADLLILFAPLFPPP